MAAFFIAEDARYEPDNRVDDRHRGHFAPVEDEVANRNLFGLEQVNDPLVEPFVAAAKQAAGGAAELSLVLAAPRGLRRSC